MNVAMMSTKPSFPKRIASVNFTCKHCQKMFVKETRFLQHKCKEMKRIEELLSPMGQAALSYYQTWLRQQKRMPPSASTFATSRYFRTMVKFAEFVNKVKLPTPDKFIWLMVFKEFPPSLWMTNEVYALYLEFLDRQTPPQERVDATIETLLDYAEDKHIDVADVFNHISGAELIDMLQKRQISPWLLLRSKKFKMFYREHVFGEQKIIMDTFIRADYWAEKLSQHSDQLPRIDKLVKELNL